MKIDTDGFDFKVLRSARETLEMHKPCIYFEWDKFHLEAQNENVLSIFSFLGELGYEWAIIYDNFGNLLCTISTSDTQNLALLMKYTKISNCNIFYYDVLLFHSISDCEEYLRYKGV
ncbi:hypothetical protein CCY99_07275 [Helicobacter sp. 16-1353]|uniref:FkbM family methyltransferase n=1 Tax=Helicobacter sp. 16-1353 TaxID=2004996 RepID=UPI000DCF181F|nr:FkbM family methyltransferase [Helicobacter sp. 16-1353]RAX52443.1 hypothetical protein CCY99_07275 [Helicobacter sp. 16-1353]